MAISINWITKVITIPQSFLTPITATLFELDVDELRLALKNIEDSEEGMGFPDTHRHNTEVVLSGVTYARTFEIINGYTITFEDMGSPYTVRCAGANHNIADVTNYTSEVSLIVGNSAGLIVTNTGGSGTDPWLTQLPAAYAPGSAGHILGDVLQKIARNKLITDPTTGIMTVYDNDNVTPLFTAQLYKDAAGTVTYNGTGGERRERLQ